MKVTTFANRIRRFYQEDGVKMEDNGYRIRVTKECKAQGDDVVELGSSYFYRHQASVNRTRDEVIFYAEHLGYEVEMEPVAGVRYRDRHWPKTSWATQLFRLKVATK